MKFAVAKEHRDFFRKNQSIEFDSLLTPSLCAKFTVALTSVLSDRCNVSKREPAAFPSDKAYLKGHDLWRDSEELKKLILSKNLAGVASDILELNPLRIAYDQLIPSAPIPNDLTRAPKSLHKISCIQGIVCGLMLCLNGSTQNSEVGNPPNEHKIFSPTIGNGVFFSPDCPIDFTDRLPEYIYIMVVYAKKISVYYKQDGDPHTNALKSLGYNFGDTLSNRHHPLVFM